MSTTGQTGYLTQLLAAMRQNQAGTAVPPTDAELQAVNVQPYDADLSAIASLTGTSGLLRKSGLNTWVLDTLNYLTTITSSQVTTALGYTPVTDARTLTINGVTYDLTANRSWTIAGGVTSFNTRTGAITLLSTDITSTLGYTPYNATNPAGYISSYTETDPTVGSHIKAITTTNISNWNTAYGWGNHASAGYLTGITSGQVTTALGYTPENAANKGVANGYASLDGSGLIPSTQLPSYVDDVLEYTNLASFPATGTTGKIYIDLATNKVYRWSGTVYIEVSPTVGTIWGGITGTLANQTDLQTALDAKVPTTRTLTINGTAFDLSANRSWTINSMVYPAAGIAVSTGTAWAASITDNSANWNTAYSSRISSLTVTGSSGAATLVSNVLNIPTYTLAGLGGITASFLSGGTGITYNSGTGVIATTITQYTDALARAAISLTTTGSSGASTYSSATGVLNVPAYTLSGLGGQPLATNLTSLAGLSYVSASFVKMTAAGTFTLDTNTYYLSSNPSNYIALTALSSTATGLTYTNTTGVFSLTTGYSIPTTASQTNWDSAFTERRQWDGGSTNLVAATGRTSLGATTVGGNLFTLVNPTAITFIRINADNTVSTLDAATFRTAIGAGTSSTTGTVTSVSGTGTVSGLSLSGTVTTTGNITLGGTLAVTASNFSSQTANTFLAAPNGAAGVPTFRTIVAADIPTLNQSTTGSAGSVANSLILKADTGTTEGTDLYTYNGSAAKTLNIVAGSNITITKTAGQWSIAAAAGATGTVSSVSVTTANGVSGTVATSTTTPAITLTLGAITPTSVNSVVISGSTTPTLAVTGTSSISGSNTGDNAVNSLYSGLVSNATHTGDATGATALTVVGLRGVALPTLGVSAGLLKYTGTGTNTWVFDTTAYGTGSVTSVSGTGTVSGLTLTGTVTTTGSLTLGGTLSLTSGNVTTALGYTPLSSYTETDTLATVTGRGNSTSTNIGSTSSGPLNFVTNGNIGTWIGGIQDATSGWSLSSATIGFKSDNNTYATIGIAGANGLLYFGRTTTTVGTLNSWLEVNNGGTANFKLARPQYNGNTILDAANYNSYAPALTGTGASGTWGINVTGTSNNITAYTINQSVGTGNSPTFTGLTISGTALGSNTAAIFGATNPLIAVFNSPIICGNLYFNSGWFRHSAQPGTILDVASGRWQFSNAATGSAGTAAATTIRGTLDNGGNFWINGDVYVRGDGSSTGTQVVYNSGTWGISISGTAGAVAWTNVTGRPTAVSSFTNDSGYITSSGNISGYAMSLNGYANQTEYIILTGPANGPVWKVRYDSATTNRYIDFGFKDGNGVYYSGFKIYDGGTPTWGGNTILHAGNYNSYSPTLTGTGASGTWGISITGNAATATTSSQLGGIAANRYIYGDGARGRSTGKTGGNANTSDSGNASGFYFGNATTGMPTTDWWNWITCAGDSWSGTDGYAYQLATSFWSDDFRFRRMTSGTWASWVSILHSGNYNSYSPTLTGGGASGTWGISITGNANYATTAGSAPNGSNANGAYNVSPGEGNGVYFWSDSTNYTIKMGYTAGTYQYGPVTDYSMRFTMGAGTGRGFTWGYAGAAPTMGLNANSGNLQIAGTFTEASSIRYKEDIQDLTYSVEDVLKLRGVTYKKKGTSHTEIGVIAEEVNDIIPEVVAKNSDGSVESVSYGRLTAVLIEAIKEQQKQINELKNLLHK